jgi:hypothetical protein
MTNCFSRPLYTDTSSTSSIRDRLKWKLETRAGEVKYKTIRRSAYLEALNKVSTALDQYKKLARCLLMPAPDEELVNNLQTISLREQWEQHKGHDDTEHKYVEYNNILLQLWPSWNPSSAQDVMSSNKKTSPADRLYGDTLQSVLMFLDAAELAACMMVSRSWMAAAKRPKVWAGKMLHVADLVSQGMSTLYTGPWASLALRHVEGVVVVGSRPRDTTYDMHYDVSKTDCYSQLVAALSLKTLPNIRRIYTLQCAMHVLVHCLVENPHVEELFVGDFAVRSSFSDRVSLLRRMPNLRVARIATYSDMYMWNSFIIHNEFYMNIDANRSLHHLVVPICTGNGESELVKLYELVSRHPSLKTLELQIYGVGSVSVSATVAIILKHCKRICGNLELLHIKQIDRTSSLILDDELKKDHLVTISAALQRTVLQETSKMHVQIELVAGALTIKRYRKMLRELPAGAAELAKERVWVRASKPNCANGDPLFSLI